MQSQLHWRTGDGGSQRFDGVLIATHADEAPPMLEEPMADEKRLVGARSFSRNETLLPSDPTFLPRRRGARIVERRRRRLREAPGSGDIDSRDLPAEGRTYDRAVSIEMLEAAGEDSPPGCFEVVDRLLAPERVAVIPSILVRDDRYARDQRRPDLIRKHAFPGSRRPSVGAIVSAVPARSRLLVHHLENVATRYDETLRRRLEAFLANLPRVRQPGYDERSARLRDCGLACCEGGFAARRVGDSPVILTRSGNRPLGRVPGYRGEA